MSSKVKKIKLLIIIESLAVGGAEGQVYELVKGLDKNQYEPVVCSLTKGGIYVEKIRNEGVKVITIANRLRGVPWKLPKIIKVLRKERFDIVHNQMFVAGLFGTLIGKLLSVPVVINSVLSLGFTVNWYRRPIKCLLYKISDCVIVNSEKIKSLLIHYRIVKKDKIWRIYNGVDIETFHPKSNGSSVSKLRNELGIASGDYHVIGILARLTPVKNHRCLLRAIPDIQEEFPKTVFLVIGNGPLEKMLKQFAKDLHIIEHIRFLGERKDTHELLRLMDLSVLCSLREGFSNSILEAMAAGIPVVASNMGGNSEAIVDGVTGFLFNPTDPAALAERVKEILKNKRRMRQMGLAGRKRAESLFSISRMVREYEGIYQSHLACKGLTFVTPQLEVAEYKKITN